MGQGENRQLVVHQAIQAEADEAGRFPVRIAVRRAKRRLVSGVDAEPEVDRVVDVRRAQDRCD
jgi:hypothetical protein